MCNCCEYLGEDNPVADATLPCWLLGCLAALLSALAWGAWVTGRITHHWLWTWATCGFGSLATACVITSLAHLIEAWGEVRRRRLEALADEEDG